MVDDYKKKNCVKFYKIKCLFLFKFSLNSYPILMHILKSVTKMLFVKKIMIFLKKKILFYLLKKDAN